MKTLADFKRRISVGVKIDTMNHRYGSFGVREVGHVQSNSFALTTIRTTGETVLSWCDFPKAKDIEITSEDTATIFWGEGSRREAILTYTFV